MFRSKKKKKKNSNRFLYPTMAKGRKGTLSPLRHRLVGAVCRNGKRLLAERIIKNALLQLGSFADMILFFSVVKRAPVVSFKIQRVAGQIHRFPSSLPYKKAISFSLRWISQSLFYRNEKKSADRLFRELLTIFFKSYNSKSFSLRRRRDLHHIVRSNRFLLQKKLSLVLKYE